MAQAATMNEHFNAYSQYYDLLYRDKDYDGEAQYVRDLVQRFGPQVRNVLELGCGTGKHAELLAGAGWHVTGVEMSDAMLEVAKERAACLRPKDDAGSFEPHLGDARDFRTARTFDAAISLFHVVSYQTSNDDVLRVFETAATHIATGGLFVFDVWYGPAVVAQKPVVRVKRMEDDELKVIRIAEPESFPDQNRVDVNYTILATSRQTGLVEQFEERHPMRYYFQPEIGLLASLTGLEVVHAEQWMTGKQPSEQTWGVAFVLKKIATSG